ncbi:TPA: hypothetical protein H1012_04340 [archaeon]|nr:hypothetical protein [Candidatus Naiadarchaeales archaeon SRR2090153.bin461]HIK03042.1 hypothetical protein [Candidatus Naiadarchaeales archaeon SRR2090159.bin1288]
MRDEALYSFIEKMRQTTKVPQSEIEKFKKFVGKDEFERSSKIYFISAKIPAGVRGNDIVLEFEIDEGPNRGENLVLPSVGLERLVAVGAKKQYVPRVKKVLANMHRGKYKTIPAYKI